MPMSFYSPSHRGGTDLAIQVSPLGMVEMSDEEFEVHGPRLNRYATAMAWWLGHHWSYRRPQGEAQITLNYVRAIADYKNNFTFGKGVQFTAPERNGAVIPSLLDLVWTQHNKKQKTLREIGQFGGVCGDVFAKIAYEEPYVDSLGMIHEGKIRIIPINPALCFPIWHPHDRTRLLQMKLKYRFWGQDSSGARTMHTYMEIMTDDEVVEFIDDQLVDQRPNPLGEISYVHGANMPIPGSPWGQSDIWDLIPINREYNEKMTEFSDILNYYSSPVTVITGAKSNQLERGAGKVWSGLPEGAKVTNLEMRTDMAPLLNYVQALKQSMHEMSGVPETALGQAQPISNTSGVALSIQFQPLMNQHSQKTDQYGEMLQRINALVIKMAALFRPDLLQWNPAMGVQAIEPDQLPYLDPADPLTYVTNVQWPDPLPVDKLIKLNEQMMMLQLGLQSKRGALEELGEQFPNDKMAEIFEEQKRDAIEDGAKRLLQANIDAGIFQLTGMVPDGQGGMTAPLPASGQSSGTGGGSSSSSGGSAAPAISLNAEAEIVNSLVTSAYGTKAPSSMTPPSSSDS